MAFLHDHIWEPNNCYQQNGVYFCTKFGVHQPLICQKLYDSNPETKIAAAIFLGVGSAKLLENLYLFEVFHLNRIVFPYLMVE